MNRNATRLAGTQGNFGNMEIMVNRSFVAEDLTQ